MGVSSLLRCAADFTSATVAGVSAAAVAPGVVRGGQGTVGASCRVADLNGVDGFVVGASDGGWGKLFGRDMIIASVDVVGLLHRTVSVRLGLLVQSGLLGGGFHYVGAQLVEVFSCAFGEVGGEFVDFDKGQVGGVDGHVRGLAVDVGVAG